MPVDRESAGTTTFTAPYNGTPNITGVSALRTQAVNLGAGASGIN